MKVAALLFCVLSFMNFADAQSSKADAIFINGNIYTGTKLLHWDWSPTSAQRTPTSRRLQAIAVRDGRILAAGSNTEIEKLKDKRTRVVDLAGHFVMPGFNDAHLHLAGGGFEKLNVDLVGTKSLDDMKSRIAARAQSTPATEWFQGRGWDHTTWPGQKLPTRQDLDAVTAGHPAIFVRVDGHIAVANSAALKAWGITAATRDPEGGRIDRDPSGEPTGILREAAKDLYMAKLPKPTPAQRRRAIELALQDAASHGITSVQDNSDWEDFLTYEELEQQGKLTLRIIEWLPLDAPVSILEQHRARHEQRDPMLHTGLLKGFMDGSLGSRTAAMLKPYADDPQNAGLPQYKQTQLNQIATQRVASRFQIGLHAIGDGGVQMALDAFDAAERYARENDIAGLGPDPQQHDFRFRIEHAQVVDPSQFARFRQLKVIASMQPNHLLTDMNWADQRIGPDRASHAYGWKEFLDNGVLLVFGTDYPVEPITPFRGIYAAVTRQSEPGKNGDGAGNRAFHPEQKLTIDQAIAAYTSWAAYAEFTETDKGSLEPGMLADFVVLDRDITKIAAPEILNTKVLRTVIGGKTVYETTE